MPRRLILTDAERHELLALPVDDDTLIRYWTLDEADHRLLDTRRQTDTGKSHLATISRALIRKGRKSHALGSDLIDCYVKFRRHWGRFRS